MRSKRAELLLILAMGISSGGCGYHVAGRTNALPKSIHTIAIPAMENKTSTFKIEQKLTAATIHEFLAKTSFKVISDPNGGDAVLTGKVLSLEVVPLLFQQPTSTAGTTVAQATAMMITMRCEVTLTQRDNDKVLYHTSNFVFRGEYQLATAGTTTTGATSRSQVEAFFQEGEPALDRMAQDFATRLLAAVTENY
jgi:outer membrane lipopolysaccharide assembly protein LptE/RlpB